MSDLNMLTKNLIEWANIHQVSKIALEAFYEYIEQFHSEEPSDFEETFPSFDKNLLQIEIENIALFLHWENMDYSYIIVRIPIIYNHMSLGTYDARFSLKGDFYTTSWNYSSGRNS